MMMGIILMLDEPIAIAGTRKAVKELVDGTLRIQIDIEPQHKAQFHKLFPEIDMPVAIAPLKPVAEGTLNQAEAEAGDGSSQAGIGAQKPSTGKYGQQAKALRQSDFFRRPEVWKAVGTPKEYATWVRTQPCIVCGDGDWHDGERICEAAHVRRSSESGTGYKADYAEVPMCHEDHIINQHKHGETKAYRKAVITKFKEERLITLDQAKDWFNKQRLDHVVAWCWEELKDDLGYDSWANVPPPVLLNWAEKSEVAGKDGKMWLPRCYYDTYKEI